LIITIRASFSEIGTPLIAGFTGAETRHSAGAFVGLIPVLGVLVTPSAAATRGLLWNRGSAGASWPIKIVFWTVVHAGISSPEATLDRLRVFKAVVPLLPAALKAAGAGFTAHRGRFVIEIGRAAGLFRGNAPQPDTFVGEKNCGAGQQELTELKNGVQAPSLKKQNPSA
jgi:hypothetical protein